MPVCTLRLDLGRPDIACPACLHTPIAHPGPSNLAISCLVCQMEDLVGQARAIVEDATPSLVKELSHLAGLTVKARDARILSSSDPVVRSAGALLDAVLDNLIDAEPPCHWNLHCSCDVDHEPSCELY